MAVEREAEMFPQGGAEAHCLAGLSVGPEDTPRADQNTGGRAMKSFGHSPVPQMAVGSNDNESDKCCGSQVFGLFGLDLPLCCYPPHE
jgi:hypothetical protein